MTWQVKARWGWERCPPLRLLVLGVAQGALTPHITKRCLNRRLHLLRGCAPSLHLGQLLISTAVPLMLVLRGWPPGVLLATPNHERLLPLLPLITSTLDGLPGGGMATHGPPLRVGCWAPLIRGDGSCLLSHRCRGFGGYCPAGRGSYTDGLKVPCGGDKGPRLLAWLPPTRLRQPPLSGLPVKSLPFRQLLSAGLPGPLRHRSIVGVPVLIGAEQIHPPLAVGHPELDVSGHRLILTRTVPPSFDARGWGWSTEVSP